MTEIAKIWEAAVKECGNKAFELLELSTGGKNEFHGTFDNEYFDELFVRNNLDSRVYKSLWKGVVVRLKPLDKLLELDIERYGKWAFLMYEIDMREDGEKPLCNKDVEIATGYFAKRKLYANAPFNLEWAKAGVKTQANTANRWKDCIISIDNKTIIASWDTGFMRVEYCIEPICRDLRHPFPPIKELEL